jgi:hypothetical protein
MKPNTEGGKIMKLKKVIYLVIILFIKSIICFGNQIQLEKRKLVIDHKDEGFFKTVTEFELYKDYIFIADFRSNNVLEFKYNSNKAEFVRFIGKKGQGPGDIQRPLCISVDADIVSIADQESISFFDIDGNFISKFRHLSNVLDILLIKKSVYVFNISDQDDLIDVFSIKGKKLKSFSKKYLNLNYKIKKTPQSIIERTIYSGPIISDGMYIFTLNRKFAVLQKYSLEGKLIIQKDLIPVFGMYEKNLVEKNTGLFLKNEFVIQRGKGIPHNWIFEDAKIENNNLFIFSAIWIGKNRFKLEIRSINAKDFKLKSIYQLNLNTGEFIRKFDVTTVREKPLFMAVISSEQGVDLYEIFPTETSIDEK